MAHYDQAPDLHPRLVIEGVDEAIAYYETTLGATLLERFADDKNRVVHARVGIGNSHISMTEQVQEWGLLSPRSLQGSAVLIHLTIADCDEIGTRMVENGGEVVIPIANRPWKKREGRIRDPFGHLWILSTPLSMTEPQHLSASG
jgi:uncharacterized glyoxalase superfamily protein PhnB